MPGVDGLNRDRAESASWPIPAVFVLTTFDADEYVLPRCVPARRFLVKSHVAGGPIWLVQVAAEGHKNGAGPAAARG